MCWKVVVDDLRWLDMYFVTAETRALTSKCYFSLDNITPTIIFIQSIINQQVVNPRILIASKSCLKYTEYIRD